MNEEAWDHIQSFILQIKHELPIGLFLKSKKVIDKEGKAQPRGKENYNMLAKDSSW